ncbi:hypothetical protein [Enterovibrio coralii]|nr:hypothetical protein [Enterovibrio coralii]
MSPGINNCDYVVAVREPAWWPKRRSSIYLFSHCDYGWIVKKLKGHLPKIGATFEGNHARSITSDDIGFIPSEIPLYRVVYVIRKPIEKAHQ